MLTDSVMLQEDLLSQFVRDITRAAMKKAISILAALFAVSAVIYAGPEPVSSGKETKEVAPAPAPSCFDWSGFYIGGFGGYKHSNVDRDFDLGGGWQGIVGATGLDRAEAAGSGDLDNAGAEAGGLIGYNFQRNCWVLGLEADGGYLWARDSTDSGDILIPLVTPLHIRSSFQTHYLFTVGPRVGYAFGRWLPYVTGGLALVDLRYAQEIAFIGIGPTFRQGGDRTDTNTGWMVGGGLQYALTDHWSLRAQYQYIDLGDVDFDGNQLILGLTPAFSHHHASLTEHNASFAIMYKF